MSNYRNILKIYKLERELSPDDVALLNTLRGMSESERELFAEALAPEKPVVQKSATRKIEKCGVEGCGLTRRAAVHKDSSLKDYHEFDSSKPQKSKRASSLAGVITGIAGNSKPAFCTYEIDGKVCKGSENDGIHDKSMGYAAYHEFQPPLKKIVHAAGAGIQTASEGPLP